MFDRRAVLFCIAIVGVFFPRIYEVRAGDVWVQYSNNFQGPIGPEWSSNKTAITPIGGRQFLWPFGAESVTLTLDNVRLHGGVRIEFDLFIIGSWDGNYASPGAGPDIWDLSIQDGQTVLHTTFNNHNFAGQYQAYPDWFPGGQYPSHTGAVEVNKLGYPCSGSCYDAVYHLDLTFDHTRHTIVLVFSGSNLESIANESWGLDNIVVWANSPLPPDFDNDGDVDRYDLMYFEACAAGPAMPIRTFPGCDATDIDGDGDADQADFGMIQRCLGPEGVAPLPYCVE